MNKSEESQSKEAASPFANILSGGPKFKLNEPIVNVYRIPIHYRALILFIYLSLCFIVDSLTVRRDFSK